MARKDQGNDKRGVGKQTKEREEVKMEREGLLKGMFKEMGGEAGEGENTVREGGEG